MSNLSRVSRSLLLLMVALFISLGTTGCFKASLVFDVDDQGLVEFHATVLGSKLLQKPLAEQRREFEKKKYLEITDAHLDDLSGYDLRFKEPLPLETCPETWGRNLGKGHITRTSSWLRDVYTIDATIPGMKDIPIPASQIKQLKKLPILIDVTINLPEAALSSNAQTIENEGKQLYWNITSCAFGEDKNVQLTFSIWNRTRVIIAIALVGTLLALVIFVPILVKLSRTNATAAYGVSAQGSAEQKYFSEL